MQVARQRAVHVLSLLIAFTAPLCAHQQVKPTTGSSSSTTGQPPSLGSTNNLSVNNTGIAGRLAPTPTNRVTVELYQDGIRVDSTYTASDGTFRFPRQQSDRRYEIRVILGPGQEVRQEVDFQGG